MLPRILIAGAIAATLSACNGSGDTNGMFRLVNGIADSGGLTAQVPDLSPLGPVDFGSVSDQIEVARGSGAYAVTLTPEANADAAFTASAVPVSKGQLTTLFGYGSIADGTQGALSAQLSLDAPADGQLSMQAVNAAEAASTGTLPSGMTFSFSATSGTAAADLSADFGSVSADDAGALAAGTYEIQVTPYDPACSSSGSQCPTILYAPIFDSGAQGVTLPTTGGSSIVQIAAIDATEDEQAEYGSSIVLLLIDSDGHVTRLYNAQS
ncbi:hypothetical protein [Solimonas marina]|uniref:DUF4397 domain-containing protein n=1 Tax=Solimonas marina TaxID=2714601 RepID=A0A969WCF0_9GAMM|nr:hypothetical protein [Solimonas marina]NKF22275.1 hypothetical protein [Solimonas marina]